MPTHCRTVSIKGVNVFYREAGPAEAPVVVLLHGFPASSQMYRGLIPLLADRFRVIAPDYPAFGHSAAPPRDRFAYTHEHLSEMMDGLLSLLGVGRFGLYAMDFGGPIGYRLMLRHPDRFAGIDEIMLDLLYDIRNNAQVGKDAVAFFAGNQSKVMVATGVNDPLFPGAVMTPPDSMPDIAFHPISGGHFALEDHAIEIGTLAHAFFTRVHA